MSKVANAIIIGGSIAVGKSSLVGSLPFIPIQELDANDELQKLLIDKMYQGDKVAPQIFQLDMLLTRFDKYKKHANEKKTHVFDRSIFEDRLFAEILFKDYPNIWEYYEGIWNDKVEELIKEVGKPKFYIYLTMSWDTFKERVFARNRKAEIDNFEENQSYFKELLTKYDLWMKKIFTKYDIENISVNTDKLDKLAVIDTVKQELKNRGFLNEK